MSSVPIVFSAFAPGLQTLRNSSSHFQAAQRLIAAAHQRLHSAEAVSAEVVPSWIFLED